MPITPPSRTVLIIDDSAEDRALYRRYLCQETAWHYIIWEAELGEEGLALWQQHRPDIILLDYCLPDMDGLEFLDDFLLQFIPHTTYAVVASPKLTAGSNLATAHASVCLPVVMITGQGSEAIALQSIQIGAQDYLVKGAITPESLRLAVSRTINTVQLQIQLQQQIARERLTHHISQQIHQSLDLPVILQTAVTEVRQFLQTDRVIIFQMHADGNGTVVAESVESPWRNILSEVIHDPCFGDSHAKQYRDGRIMAKPNIRDGSLAHCYVELLAGLQVYANLVVPILREGELWGLLIAHHCAGPRPWQKSEVELLQNLAVHLGIALQQSRAYGQLEQESEARYRAIVEDQTDLILRCLPDTTVQFANSAYCRYFGLPLEQVLGQSYESVILESDRPQVRQALQALGADNPTTTIEIQVVVDNAIRWTQWSSRILFDDRGKVTEIQMVGRDITTLKEAEAQLRHSTERMSLANAELARAARLKDEFLATMSHELRTPLNSILGLSEVLLEEAFGRLNERQRTFVETISNSGEHLLRLINDILDLSKIESGKMDLEMSSVSICQLCQSSLDFVKQSARQKEIYLISQVETTIPDIEADERRLSQVLINLLTNAVKFTPSGGQVCLQARMNIDQQMVELAVKDTGIGIAADQFEEIFQPFTQVDTSLARKYEGTGLGLSIVKRLVNLHGGSIQLESTLGQGSCFTVRLPWHPPTPPVEAELLPIDAPSIHRPRQPAAAVDADPPWNSSTQFPVPTEQPLINPVVYHTAVGKDVGIVAKKIKRYLSEFGVLSVLHPVATGSVEIAVESHPDVIFLDSCLPDESGLNVLMQLKANPRTQDIRVIMIAESDERSRSLELGAMDCLVKPISRQSFYQAFTPLFNINARSSPKTALIVTPEAPTKTPTILLAEDNEASIITVQHYLESHHYNVVLARNGVEAVQLTQQCQPDLVLMDIQMPGLDGLQAIQQIRNEARFTTLPIIALTALAMPTDMDRCLQAGANDYLTKPVQFKQLVDMVKTYLYRYESN